MSWSDPIADMLTRIRNAQRVGAEMVEMPHSRLKVEIVRVLKREAFVGDYVVDGSVKKVLRVFLRYGKEHEPVIRGLRRESKAGRRVYARWDRVPRVLNGMGISVLSTSSGVLSDTEARKRHLGGEVLCTVW
jgi:small subunit ribosomal protein S8